VSTQYIRYPSAGGGGGGGTVTSVGLALPASVFSVSGSPVTTTGTLTGSFISQTANQVLASPNGSSGVPVFRSLVANDIPSLSQYALLAGRAGGQTLNGGTATTDQLILAGTSNATQAGAVQIQFQSTFMAGDTAPAGLTFYEGLGLQSFDFYYSTDADSTRYGGGTREYGLFLESISNSSATPVIINFGKARGASFGALTYNDSGDHMGQISVYSFAGATPFDYQNSSINIVANENHSGGAQGSRIVFMTTPNGTTSETTTAVLSATSGLELNTGNLQVDTGNLSVLAGSASIHTTLTVSSLTTGYVQTNGSGLMSTYAPKGPTSTVYTSGSGNYTPPAGTLYIEVELVSGGGGGGPSGTSGGTAATAGGASLFNTINPGGGAAGGGALTAGTGQGGAASGGILSIQGNPGNGGGGGAGTGSGNYGGNGGGGPWGGAGQGGDNTPNPGLAGSTNSGSGGGGGGGTAVAEAGNGGGAGGSAFSTFNAPFTSIPYTVGAGGTGGSAGVAGAAGGNGAAGIIKILEYYQ
jgi:hypothetical protein